MEQYKKGLSAEYDSYGTCDYCEDPDEYLYDSKDHLICWECLGFEDSLELNATKEGNRP